MLPEPLAGSGRDAELELLLACSRVTLESGDAERIVAALRPDLDWAYVLRAAHVHGVLPLLHRHLGRRDTGNVPAPVANELRECCAISVQRGLLLTAALAEALRLLASAKIAAVPFKGPLLASLLYGDFGMRPFRDVDILVPRRDLLLAVAALERAGFGVRPPLSGNRLSARVRSAWVSDVELVRETAVVELHWRLTPRCFGVPGDLDEIAGDLVDANVAGLACRTLSHGELLLYLCTHGATHRWVRLEWICDVAELLRRDVPIEWELVRARAARRGELRMLALGLHLAHDLLGAPLPPEPLASLSRGPQVRALARRVVVGLPDTSPDPNPGLRLAPFHVAMRERLRDRARYLASILFAPSPLDIDAIALPPSLYGLYYLIRPFRLLTARLPSQDRARESA